VLSACASIVALEEGTFLVSRSFKVGGIQMGEQLGWHVCKMWEHGGFCLESVFDKMSSRSVVLLECHTTRKCVHGHGKREFGQFDRQCEEGRRILNLANQNHLSFVFCQLVAAIQMLWIEGRHALLCFNYLNSHDFLKIGTVHLHAWSSFLAVPTQICNTTRQKF